MTQAAVVSLEAHEVCRSLAPPEIKVSIFQANALPKIASSLISIGSELTTEAMFTVFKWNGRILLLLALIRSSLPLQANPLAYSWEAPSQTGNVVDAIKKKTAGFSFASSLGHLCTVAHTHTGSEKQSPVRTADCQLYLEFQNNQIK